MKIGLVGPSSQQRSLPFNAQRTVNLFPVMDQQGKEIVALYRRPGLTSFSTAGSGPIRGGFGSTKDRVFFVSGSSLYEVDSSGVSTSRGTLLTSTGNVYFDENPTQLFICDGTYGYIFTYATNVLARITDADFPSAGSVTFSNSYFIVSENSTGKFHISAVSDGTSWASEYATAESSPDLLRRVIRALGALWLLGASSFEIWTATSDAVFPFQRVNGSEKPIGIMAPATAIEFMDSLFWVAETKDGSNFVVRTSSFSPEVISTEAIDYAISKATDKENMKAIAYQKEGHGFYILTGGGLETSLVYDTKTKEWHEQAYLNLSGSYETHLASSIVFAFDKHLVGDRRNGNIYYLDEEADDSGTDVTWERVFTHITDEGKLLRFKKLIVGVEPGVGSEAGSDPYVYLRVSKDFGKTWSNSYGAPIGKIGEYDKSVAFTRLGISSQITFKLSGSYNVKTLLCGAYLS